MKRYKVLLIAATFIGVILIIGGSIWWRQVTASPFEAVRRKADFLILIPDGKEYRLIRDSVVFEPKTKILTFRVKADMANITLTQQATPSIMATFPEMLTRQFSLMKNKKTLSTALGPVYMAENQDMANQQLAATNTQGTLLFARPDKGLTESQWRSFFNKIAIEKK